MIDDLTYASFRAISDRTKVYMVFVPPKVYERTQALADPRSRRVGTNLVGGQYTSYAVVALRSVGDQPGQIHPRYLSDWKFLPEGILIATNKYSTALQDRNTTNEYRRAFARISTDVVPFPTARDLDLPASPNRF